ncbi:MAG: ATP-binding cassette domain-containing protein, partial [Crocinitomicaceae bacterium]|nr:ATP-binding cassette domain-containing protein [Crocinitomicaceae bacterium]
IDWLRQYVHTDEEREEVYLRTFLGRMLFTGEEALKTANVLSGGEKVRCMLSKMMLAKANLLMMDEPTNHLDLESITSLNDGMAEFQGTMLFTSHDHELVNTVANRIIEITPNGAIDKMMSYSDFLKDEKIAAIQEGLYA